MTDRSPALVRVSTLGLVFFVAQIAVGAANVWSRGSSRGRSCCTWRVAVLIWATVVALATVALGRRARSGGSADPKPDVDETGEAVSAVGTSSLRDTITAYYRFTKPRIVVLLLMTTVPAMLLAAGGMPSIWLILATLVGGALAAGSANSVNMYLDRDIDEIMKRTRQRPLPCPRGHAGEGAPLRLRAGRDRVLLPLDRCECAGRKLALSAIAFYVFVYTMWLKRTTAQNIVIGGAAGAVPALVGWAAVTGTLAAPAVGPVRDRVRLDPATLLGAGDALQRRLRGRRRADAPRGQRRRRDPTPDLPVLARAVRDDAAAVPGGLDGARLPVHRGRHGGVFVYRALSSGATERRRAAGGSSSTRSCT